MNTTGRGGDAGDPPFRAGVGSEPPASAGGAVRGYPAEGGGGHGGLLGVWSGRTVAVVGLGLVGASWAGAVGPLVRRVHGADVLADVRRLARERGLVQEAWRAPGRWLGECDLVVMAVPPDAMARVAGACLPRMKRGAILTDVCSVKGDVVEELLPLLGGRGVIYVPGHPLAGRERSGLAAAHPQLLRGAPYVLCDPHPGGEEGETAWRLLAALVEGMGAHPLRVGARDHDRLVAVASHLPYLVGVALARTLGEVEAGGLPAAAVAATGFRDTTRVVLSPPELWAEILTRNPALPEVAGRFLDDFSFLLQAVRSRPRQLASLLEEGERVRRAVDSVAGSQRGGERP